MPTEPTPARSKITQQARQFTAVAVALLILGLIILTLAICHAIAGDPSKGRFIISGSILTAAFWLYLLAQLIHIRANTEK